MSTTAQKNQYLSQVQSAMTELANLNTRLQTLAALFAARQYDANAEDPITESDLNNYGVAPYDLGIAVNTFQAVNALCAGQANNVNAAIPVTLSKWRVV